MKLSLDGPGFQSDRCSIHWSKSFYRLNKHLVSGQLVLLQVGLGRVDHVALVTRITDIVVHGVDMVLEVGLALC